MFRFAKGDIPRLAQALRLPNKLTGYQGTVCYKIEALCLFLRCLAYPCRYNDLVPIFGRPKEELSIISNAVLDFIYTEHKHLLNTFLAPWMNQEHLFSYCEATHERDGALDNCWGFIDGTVRPICRPENNQRHVFNGHKRTHALKYQSVVVPSGLIVHMFGPMEGKRHDARIFVESGLYQQLEAYSFDATGKPLCIYGDGAYPVTQHVQGPFKGPHLTMEQQAFNISI
ncbi:uncharacterized protein LOC114541044 [Dendronephthya gigantea]|uniref:uncharacterized protein LOC114541044 n=1 Tax=Dendronephthya gigantea TaxID=151771 RepID=UPI00106CC242|nr:uncharacterized protein LOC114541044 [Dendronephthya gigantea]